MIEPIYRRKVDSGGREYLTGYSCINSKCCIAIGDKEYVVSGQPKINVRRGPSKNGNELFFEHYVDKVVKKKASHSKHDTIEIYLPLRNGLKLIDGFLNYLEGRRINP